MDYGSTHVWLYDDSDEEFISDSELQEGMWLSDDEDDEPLLLPVQSSLKQKQPQEDQQQPLELISSTTKYEHIPELPTSDSGKSQNYADLEWSKAATAGAPPPPPPSKSDKKRVNYVEVPPQQPKPSAVQGQSSLQRSAAAKPPTPPPLPPAPKGIIKTRLVPGLKKMRKQRVRWDNVKRSSGNESRETQRGRRTRRTDTNILAVKFNKLIGPSHVHTGDAVVCCNPCCTSILSHLSKVEEGGDTQDEKEWVCEFCGSKNEVDIVAEEIPTEGDTTYMIAPAPVVGGGAEGGASMEESLVVFCIDISGSMCVTTEVSGKFELKGHDRMRGFSSLNVHGEDQYMPRQRRDVTYISRLQSVQAAVDHQLSALASSHPTQRVSLVTFSDEVAVIGDGRGEVVTVAGDKLWSSDALVKIGEEVTLPAAVRETRSALSKRVFDLEEGGQTALGPAVLLSVSIASRVPGSKVIICTDGLANKGVGHLDDLTTDEVQAAAQTFYEDLGALALEKNVTVSLVTIKGTDCKTMELGQVADTTGGQVTIVDPLNITKEFSSILANPVIATDVMTKIILHSDLYFRTEESKDSVLTIPVGNVTADTELSYEYGVRNTKKEQTTPPTQGSTEEDKGAVGGGASPDSAATPKEKEVAPLTIDGKPHLPFQLQIEYTGLDGSRCMRVITQAKPITRDRGVAERDIQMAVVGTHAAHTSAKLAMKGEFTHARLNALVSQRLMQRTSHASSERRFQYANVMEDLIPLENELRDRQQRERTLFGQQYSDDESEEQFFYGDTRSELMSTNLALEDSSRSRSEPIKKRLKAAPKKKKAISRRKEISDDLATYCYQMRSSKSSDYTLPDDKSDKEES